jgi:hypothetical protein
LKVWSLTTDFEFNRTSIPTKYIWNPPLRRLAFFGPFDLALVVRDLGNPDCPLQIKLDEVRSLEIEERDKQMVHVGKDILNAVLSMFMNIREFRFAPCSTYSRSFLPLLPYMFFF